MNLDWSSFFLRFGNPEPAIGGMLKVFCFGRRKQTLLGLPLKSIDRNVWTLNANDIERVCFTPSTIRCRGSCLHHQRRVPFNLVARGAVRRVANMQVARQKDVRTAACQPFHRHARASHQVALVVPLRQIEWMMCDDNLHYFRIESTEAVTHPIRLLLVYAPTFNREGTSSVNAKDDNLVIIVYRS